MRLKARTMNLHFLILLFISLNVSAFTDAEERWLNAIDETDTIEKNEAKLKFIKPPLNKNTLYSTNTLTISQKSIDDGWVDLHQCYRYLDKLPEVDITYYYRSIKNLRLISKKNIQSAILKEQSITLKNIKHNAEICISAEVRIFYQNPDLSFSLVNGPYHRRFLDGFYPYHVTLHISYPEGLLSFVSSKPKQQEGFSIVRKSNELLIDTYFEGILNTEIKFVLLK